MNKEIKNMGPIHCNYKMTTVWNNKREKKRKQENEQEKIELLKTKVFRRAN